jgi:hypothetical protein
MDPRYNPWAGQMKINYAGMRNDPNKLRKAQDEANGLKGWANAAPWIGTALGGVAGGVIGGVAGGPAGILGGATTGAGLGGSVGNGIGTQLNSQADAKLDPFREKEMRQEAMWMALQGMR